MKKELRFSTSSLNLTDTSEDCVLDPSDPVHALRRQGALGTLNPAAHNSILRQQIAQKHFQLRDEAQRMGIRPGTPAWFALNQGG